MGYKRKWMAGYAIRVLLLGINLSSVMNEHEKHDFSTVMVKTEWRLKNVSSD